MVITIYHSRKLLKMTIWAGIKLYEVEVIEDNSETPVAKLLKFQSSEELNPKPNYNFQRVGKNSAVEEKKKKQKKNISSQISFSLPPTHQNLHFPTLGFCKSVLHHLFCFGVIDSYSKTGRMGTQSQFVLLKISLSPLLQPCHL